MFRCEGSPKSVDNWRRAERFLARSGATSIQHLPWSDDLASAILPETVDVATVLEDLQSLDGVDAAEVDAPREAF